MHKVKHFPRLLPHSVYIGFIYAHNYRPAYESNYENTGDWPAIYNRGCHEEFWGIVKKKMPFSSGILASRIDSENRVLLMLSCGFTYIII